MIAFDTNVIVYGFQNHPHSQRARELARRGTEVGAILALQAVGEFANVCRRKTLLSPSELSPAVAMLLTAFRIAPTTPALVQAALDWADRYRLSYFDALIVTVSEAAGASILLSEDMHDGLAIGRLTILDPFNSRNAATIDGAF